LNKQYTLLLVISEWDAGVAVANLSVSQYRITGWSIFPKSD